MFWDILAEAFCDAKSEGGLWPLVSIRFQFLFHSPNRGAFHLSLTVLVHYRCLCVFSLRRWSSQILTGFHVSRDTQEQPKQIFPFQIRGCNALWPDFPDRSSRENFVTISHIKPACRQSGMSTGCPITPFSNISFRTCRKILDCHSRESGNLSVDPGSSPG